MRRPTGAALAILPVLLAAASAEERAGPQILRLPQILAPPAAEDDIGALYESPPAPPDDAARPDLPPAPVPPGSGAPAPAALAGLTPEAVEAASFRPGAGKLDPALIMKLQILLDRRRLSPGVVDGLDGDNLRKALRLFEAMNLLPVDGRLDAQAWQLLAGDAAPVLTRYTITAADVAGPFLPAVPQDFGEMARLDRLAYTSPRELLAERFHMDERALMALNPRAEFAVPGTEIVVAAVGAPAKTKVARIVADKRVGQVRAYDAAEQLVAAYPATIGSTATPSPSGTHKVEGVAIDPIYYYDPERNFRQGENTEKLQLPPGPNGPVGNVWIDLSKPTYGIHGTPEPAKIGKTASRGCVRLTNWDAGELARLVSPGVTVTFLEKE